MPKTLRVVRSTAPQLDPHSRKRRKLLAENGFAQTPNKMVAERPVDLASTLPFRQS
jgi:hypothetical protein